MVSSWISDHDWDVSMGAPSSVSEAPGDGLAQSPDA
jgi:hypothetical protein